MFSTQCDLSSIIYKETLYWAMFNSNNNKYILINGI